MANLFINLPVPASDGNGAAVDISGLGTGKTIIVGQTLGTLGETFRCTLNVQISNAAAAPVNDNEWEPLYTTQAPGTINFVVAAKWARAVRQSSKFPAGTPSCDIAADDGAVAIANLPTTLVDGSGASVDTSGLGPIRTITCGGAFGGTAVIEVSDDNVRFVAVASFTGTGDQKTVQTTSSRMRVTRAGTPTIAPGQPIVNIACGGFPGTGGGGASGEQFFTVAGVAGQSLYAVVLPVARANATYQVVPVVSSPAANMMKLITVDPTTIANAGFTAELSANAEAGDILVFFVHDL